MTASVLWKEVKPAREKRLNVGAPSSFAVAMERAFGPAPWRLSADEAERLKGMACVFGDDADNPFTELAELVTGERVVEVWLEY